MENQLREIITALASLNESDRCYALEDLQQLNDPTIVPYMVNALEDHSVRVRETAVESLIKVGGTPVAEAAAALLSSENVPLRNAAIEVLEMLGSPAVSVLEKYICSPSVDIRKFAIDTLGKLLSQAGTVTPSVLGLLIASLSDQDGNVAGAAAEALGMTKNDLAVPSLVKQIFGENQSTWLQCNIIVALSRISSEQSLQAIREIDDTRLSGAAKTYIEMALKGEVL